jgi:exosortase A-associated hydrolase 1
VLSVVGGPQHRVGSHRQFVLLANDLAAQGYAVMRFDYRGMGDSTGEPRTFENVGEDLRNAVDHFLSRVPEVTEVVIWGLCDAASAALFYAHLDPRVTGMVLLNPWVRTAQGEARTYLKHYYLRHAFSAAPWAKLLRGQFDLAGSAAYFVRNLRQAGAGGTPALPERMARGLARFKGRVLFILSGNDLTAKEFSDMAAGSKRWRRLLQSPKVVQRRLPMRATPFAPGLARPGLELDLRMVAFDQARSMAALISRRSSAAAASSACRARPARPEFGWNPRSVDACALIRRRPARDWEIPAT